VENRNRLAIWYFIELGFGLGHEQAINEVHRGYEPRFWKYDKCETHHQTSRTTIINGNWTQPLAGDMGDFLEPRAISRRSDPFPTLF
jgi:hypothetical protein